MTKTEFLEGLSKSLSSTGSLGLVRENLKFYDEYIDSEIEKGRSEEEVLGELGDPRLIANSIKESVGIDDEFAGSETINDVEYEEFPKDDEVESKNVYKENHYEENPYEEDIYKEDSYEQNVEEENYKIKYINPNLIIYGAVGVVFLVVVVALTLTGLILKFLGPVLIPFIVILLVIRLFRR